MKKNLYLFQPQYVVDHGFEKNYWIPYSIGCVWSYANQFQDIADTVECKDIIFKRDNFNDVLTKIHSPDICAFSCYQWNKNYNFELAKQIKKLYPQCIIVFGGPEVNDAFLAEEYIDTIILGEGENPFVNLLRSVVNNVDIPRVYSKSRVMDLAMLPSPYATGVFDKIILDNPGIKWATTLETNRGCPFSCTFCDWGSLTYSKIKKFDLARVSQDLDWIAANPISYIFCADANFGIFKDRDLEIAKMVKLAGDQNKTLESFNATFNKNNNEWSFKILEELEHLNRGFTVSVQSMNPDTLTAIKRDNLGINDLEKIFKLCQDNKINSYTELILGLPLETKDSFINGLCKLLELGQHNHVEIWFVDLLVNSELANATSQSMYEIKTITTGNYLTLNSDSDPCQEDIQIVCETSTMTTDDMVESFMYGWVIVNLHMQGYTQLTSRFYNKKYNIEFKTFYNTLIDKLKNDPLLGQIYYNVKNNLENLLYQGVLPHKLSGHNLIFCNGQLIYQHKEQVFSLVNQTVEQLIRPGQIHTEIAELQKLAIFDEKISYPIIIESSVDIDQSNNYKCSYIVEAKVTNSDLLNFNNFYYMLRRKGALKNSITKKVI